jgi:hypothetical protein
MPHYALSIYQPDGPPPPPELLGPVMEKIGKMIEEARAAKVWVFNGGLHAPSTASVVRVKANDVLTTDGPFVEGKEHIGGFMVLDVPDLDAALMWAGKLCKALQLPGHTDSLPVEVRPFAHVDAGRKP